jgi:hypothetical protein
MGLNEQNTPNGCQYYTVVTQLQEQMTLASAIQAAAFSVWIGPFLQQSFAARTDIPYITIKSNAWGSDFTGLTLAHEMWHVVQGSTGESSDPSSIANPNVRVADLEMSEELCQQLSNWAEPQAYRYQQFAEQLLAEPWVWCQYPDNPFPRIEKPTQCELNGGLPGDFCAEDAELPRDGCW